jgi:hypothetical protein
VGTGPTGMAGDHPTMIHMDWCQRQAQDHAACYRLIGTVTIGPDTTAVIELHKARDVPAVVTLTTVRGPRRSMIPLHVEAAHTIAQHLDQAVALLVTRSDEPGSTVHSTTPG